MYAFITIIHVTEKNTIYFKGEMLDHLRCIISFTIKSNRAQTSIAIAIYVNVPKLEM